MRPPTAVLFICALLLLALVPWAISSCSPRPLLPDELRQARTQYEERVEAAQAATMEAQRQGDSIRKVIPLGTISVTVTAVDAMPTTTTTLALIVTPSPPLSPTIFSTPTVEVAQLETQATKIPGSSAVVIVRTTVLTPTIAASLVTTETAGAATNPVTSTLTPSATSRVIVVHADATPSAPTSAPVNGGSAPAVSGRPAGLVASIDVISEEMLTTQIQQEARDLSIADVTVRLAPDGFHAYGKLALGFGISRPVEVHGTFAVENDSLVAKVSSILLNGLDVTDQYRGELEGRINWGLYQLLPQRYVDSFELGPEQVTVQSQMRP